MVRTGEQRRVLGRLMAVGFAILAANATAAAMNKVRDEHFEWKVLRTAHFDIHFYSSPAKLEPDGVLPRAREVAAWLEAGLVKNTALLGVEVTRRVPVFLYRSHTDFEQTNLYPAVPVGVGAFAESLRDRIVIPLYPSERYMQRVLGLLGQVESMFCELTRRLMLRPYIMIHR